MKIDTVSIDIFPDWFETCGDRSLEGLLTAAMEKTQSIRCDTLILVFHNTSSFYRAANSGPELVITPEFSVPCFLESVFRIQSWGVRVVIQMEYDWSPKRDKK